MIQPYRNLATVVKPEVEVVNGGILLRAVKPHECKPPGWWSCWWNSIRLEDKWKCPHCNVLHKRRANAGALFQYHYWYIPISNHQY